MCVLHCSSLAHITFCVVENPLGIFGKGMMSYDEKIGGIFYGMSFIGFITVVIFHLFICVIFWWVATSTTDRQCFISLVLFRRLLICVTSDYDDGCAAPPADCNRDKMAKVDRNHFSSPYGCCCCCSSIMILSTLKVGEEDTQTY